VAGEGLGGFRREEGIGGKEGLGGRRFY
jgi:hypothetical protein